MMRAAPALSRRAAVLGQPGPVVTAVLAVTGLGWLGLLAGAGAGIGGAAGHWVAMCAAMMAPTLIPPLGHLRARSFAARRTAATAVFVACYAGLWCLFGAVATVALAPVAGHPATAPVLCLLAALWQLSPVKAHALARCHERPGLAAFGPQMTRDAMRFGLRHGALCMASCGALMLPMVVEHDLQMTLILTLLIWKERAAHRPDPRAVAYVLVGLAIYGALGALTHTTPPYFDPPYFDPPHFDLPGELSHGHH